MSSDACVSVCTCVGLYAHPGVLYTQRTSDIVSFRVCVYANCTCVCIYMNVHATVTNGDFRSRTHSDDRMQGYGAQVFEYDDTSHGAIPEEG